MTDFGIDFAGYLDIDSSFSTVTGKLAVAHAVARRLVQPKGGLIDAPNYGWDVRQLINAPVNAAFAESRIQDECEQDERVLSAVVTVNFEPRSSVVDIVIDLRTADGPFSMTLHVSQVSVSLLLPNLK